MNHKNNEEVWLTAARWYVHDKKQTNEAIKLLKKGIAIHRTSKALYSECIFYEITNVENPIKDESVNKKYNILNKKLEKYIAEMIANIKDYAHYIEILKYMETYEFTLPSQNLIVDYLMKDHCDNEMVWDYLANRSRRVFHYVCDDKAATFTKKTRIRACINKYEEGLQTVSDEKKQALWNLYLKCLVNIKNEEFIDENMERNEILISAFEKASQDGSLLEECYISWLELVNDDDARNVLLMGTDKCPLSVDLWKLRLRYEIAKDGRESIINTFNTGIAILGENSCPLWITMLKFHILDSEDADIEDFFRAAIFNADPTTSNSFKTKYIEWVNLKFGIERTREVYFGVAKLKPFCKELYLQLCSLESIENFFIAKGKRKYDTWEGAIKLACEQFGQEDINCWIKMVEFYIYHKHNIGNMKEKVEKVIINAKAILPEYLYFDFEEKLGESKLKELANIC